MNAESMIALGQSISAKRIKGSTRSAYNSRVQKLQAWLKVEHVECIDDDDAIILQNLDDEVLLEFMTFASIKCDKAGMPLEPRQWNALATVG